MINCTGDNAGIMFTMVTDLLLEKLAIQNCGFKSFLRKRKGNQQIASVKIMNGLEVTIKNVTIENGTGTGLSLVNVGGNVTVENCVFRHNAYYVDQMYRVVNIKDNDFAQRGGGMQILINSFKNRSGTYQILKCKFISNFASSGGGLFVVIQYGDNVIHINIANSHFINNTCKNGGGGVQVGYTTPKGSKYKKANNSIIFGVCVFKGNNAGYGGGTAIFSSLGSLTFTFSKIQLSNCSWSKNSADRNGMAVDIAIAPWETITGFGLCPKPEFKHCNFTQHSRHNNIFSSPRSIFTVTRFEVWFKEQIIFEDNNGTAIDATAAVLSIAREAKVHFVNNQGINGGAMRLKGPSVILVRDSSTLLFQKNTAIKSGGAIFVDSSTFFTCFIKKIPRTKKQPKFFFSNNTAGYKKCRNRGNSIYASSILPCLERCSQDSCRNVTVSEALKNIGTFQFDETSRGQQITSAPHHFSTTDTSNKQDNQCDIFIANSTIYSKPNHRVQQIDYHNNIIHKTLHVIPGRQVDIPLKLVDELCEEIFFHVSVEVLESNNGSIFISHSIITNNYITLYGNPQDYGILQFSAAGVRDFTLSVQLSNCPPGYIHNTDTMSCVCSLTTKLHYPGIERCNRIDFRAYVKHGYWLGYVKNQTRQDSLASATCPKGFCANNASEYPLPSVAVGDLSSYICNKGRRGIICGSCKTNYSTYYRSASFSCKSNSLCYLGWLFYIISEMFPVTVLFFIVIYFNISFTSGALNGVILFMQVIDTLKIDGENSIQFGDTVRQFSRVYKIVYRAFLLKFFAIEELSFCLWEGATALDMLAFRYVTIVYSLFLVIVTVIILRKCTFRIRSKQPNKEPSLNLKHSILNGLSAFLVMSYSECAQVTLMILTTGTLTVGPIENIYTSYKYDSVAFYNGNYKYMGPQHLKYALPAFVFLLTLVALPPILLIVYPLCYKLFALLRIDESKFVKIICKVIPLEKIKPMFDAMQSEFKDQYRFFAGLYFIFRLSASVTFTYATALKYNYFATNVQLIFILVLHSICFPYKKKWHNVLDAFLFANLALINAIASFNYTSSNQSVLTNLAGLQCGLILLPLVYLIAYTIYNIALKIKVKMTSSTHKVILQENNNSNDVLEMLDARNVDESEEPIDYVLLKENK